MEVFRKERADDLNVAGVEGAHCIRGRDRHGNNHFSRGVLTHRGDSREHRRTRRESVIDQQERPSAQDRKRAVAPVAMFATEKLFHFVPGSGFDHVGGKQARDVVVQKSHASRSDCAERQLLVSRHAEFAHHEHIKRHAQQSGDLKFLCEVDYRGYIRNLRIERNPDVYGYNNYGYRRY